VCLAFAMGADALEVLHVTRGGDLTRSGLLSLTSDASPGAIMLLRLLYSSAEQHYGYVRPSDLPSPFVPEGLKERLTDFTLLKRNRSQQDSGVYGAMLGSTKPVVVKFSYDGNEVCVVCVNGLAQGRMASWGSNPNLWDQGACCTTVLTAVARLCTRGTLYQAVCIACIGCTRGTVCIACIVCMRGTVCIACIVCIRGTVCIACIVCTRGTVCIVCTLFPVGALIQGTH
jgi:hypothetical protein